MSIKNARKHTKSKDMEISNRSWVTDLKHLLSPRNFIPLNIGALMVAAGVYFFRAPNGFSTGGVSGFSILLSRVIGTAFPGSFLTYDVLNLSLNVILLVIGFIFLGRSCGLGTAYCTLAFSLEVSLFTRLNLLAMISGGAPTLTDQPFLELLYDILLTGVGSSILFQYNASSGGTDIVAMIIKKFTSLEIGRSLLATDALIALSSLFLSGVKTGLFSLLGLFMKAFLVDGVIESMNLCKCFMVVTAYPKEIEAFITTELHHSATEIQGRGIYSGADRKVILTICRSGEAVRLKQRVKEKDPDAFIIITNSSEIFGRGFRSA